MNISRIALKLHSVPKFEPDAVIGQKGMFCKGLSLFVLIVTWRIFIINCFSLSFEDDIVIFLLNFCRGLKIVEPQPLP